MKVIKNTHPPAAGESPGGLPPPTIAGPDAALSQISNLFQISCSPQPGTRALPHRKPNIKYQGRSGGKWGAQYFQYLNSLKYSNELESSKYQATPRPHPPNGLLQGPAPVAIPTETSIANFLNVSYGHPYHPCVGAPEATASCGLWGCLIPNGGDH